MIGQRKLLLAKAFCLLLGVRLGLALLSFRRLQPILNVLGGRQPRAQQVDSRMPDDSCDVRTEDATIRTVRQVIWAVEKSAALMPGGAKCLAKALTTQVLMERRGCDCTFQIGVAKTTTGELEAHAWVEQNGQIVMGFLPNIERFQRLPLS